MQIVWTGLLVALGALHLVIMGLEMWAAPQTQARMFAMPLAFVKQAPAHTAMVNQGIYNGVLGLLFWLSVALPAAWAMQMALVAAVLIVGLIGGFTATKKIFLIQCLPAVVTLGVGLLVR